MEFLQTDDSTIYWSICLVVAYAISKLLKPQSLVHPLLLGRQADVGRVRMPSESPVYRNYATGTIGRLPERPKPEVRTLSDIVLNGKTDPKRLWSQVSTNAELLHQAESLGTGLVQIGGLIPKESTALLLLKDSLEFLITDLALSMISVVSFTLSTPSLLSKTLEHHTPSVILIDHSMLETLIEHIADVHQSTHHAIIVLGDEKQASLSLSQKLNIRILRWEDIAEKGKTVSKLATPSVDPKDVFSISIYPNSEGELEGAQLTHVNVTAGITSARLFFPINDGISSIDTLLSTFPLSTPFGRALLYTALYEGASFTSLTQSFDENILEPTLKQVLQFCEEKAIFPTIMALHFSQVQELARRIMKTAKSNPLYALGWRHKLVGLTSGYLTKVSFWDNLVWGKARVKVLDRLDSSLRGIIMSNGQFNATEVDEARISLSVPIISTYSHPLNCGPVLMSHPLDLQSFPSREDAVAHIGGPAPNVEVKLVGVDDSSVDQGAGPFGELYLRGPSVAVPLSGGPTSQEGWTPSGQWARAQKNGTFVLSSS